MNSGVLRLILGGVHWSPGAAPSMADMLRSSSVISLARGSPSPALTVAPPVSAFAVVASSAPSAGPGVLVSSAENVVSSVSSTAGLLALPPRSRSLTIVFQTKQHPSLTRIENSKY